MKTVRKSVALTTILCSLILVSARIKPLGATADKTLREAYKNYFPVGVAVAPRNLTGPEAELIIRQFSSVTPENAMKMGPIHPQEKSYFWQDADAIVDFAQQNNIKLRGHTLCWDNQTPNWLLLMPLVNR